MEESVWRCYGTHSSEFFQLGVNPVFLRNSRSSKWSNIKGYKPIYINFTVSGLPRHPVLWPSLVYSDTQYCDPPLASSDTQYCDPPLVYSHIQYCDLPLVYSDTQYWPSLVYSDTQYCDLPLAYSDTQYRPSLVYSDTQYCDPPLVYPDTQYCDPPLVYPDFLLDRQAVGLVLILLDLPGNLRHFPPLLEVDNALRSIWQEVWVAFFRLENIGQVHACRKETEILQIIWLELELAFWKIPKSVLLSAYCSNSFESCRAHWNLCFSSDWRCTLWISWHWLTMDFTPGMIHESGVSRTVWLISLHI